MHPPSLGERLRRRSVSPWAILVAGLVVTGVMTWALRDSLLDEARLRFATAFDQATARVSLLLGRQVSMMLGASGLFVGERDGQGGSEAVGDVVDARSFERFVASLNLGSTYPGVRSIAFARRTAGGELSAVIAARRAEVDEPFAVEPGGERPLMYPIVYLSADPPREKRRLGVDVYAEAARRDAIDRAVASGAPALTAPLQPAAEHRRGSEPEVAIYVPVYRFVNGDRVRGEPFGCLECEIDLDEFITAAIAPATTDLAVTVRDGSVDLFRVDGAAPGRLHGLKELAAAGRVWSMEAAAATNATASIDRVVAGMLASGIALSGLLCALTFREMRARTTALLASERLRAAEVRSRRLVEANVVGVVVGNADGRVVDANEAFLHLAGVHRDDLAGGLDWRRLMAPESTRRHDDALAALRRGESVKPDETDLVRPDGRRVPILLCLALIDAPDTIAAFVIDLTDLRDAQRRLAQSERLFRTMADHAPVMIRTTDPGGRGVYFNRPWLAFTGRTLDQMLGDGWLSVIHPDDRAMLMEARAAALTRREPFAVEHRLLDASGVWRWVLDQGAPLPGESDNGIIGSCIDIDSRRRARDEAMRLSDELARSNADLAEFAGVVSHDLQEPLRIIDRYSELVVRRYGDRLDDDGRRFLAFTRDGAVRMRALINDLLAYARAGGSRERQRCDTDEICRCAIANLSVAIDECGAVVAVQPLAPVIGDRPQLIQLFQNLIGNAIKYRSPERAPRVDVTMRRSGGELEFSVSDNGIGIAPEHQARIFGAFQRLHTRDEYPGTGIGLAVCRRIVERHGGRIWVESGRGCGSTFRFTLPAGEGVPLR